MRLTHLPFAVIIVLCSVTVHVPNARAENTTCANAEYLFPGEMAEDTLPAAGSIFFKTSVVAGRSYSIAAWAPFSEVAGGPLLTVALLASACASDAESASSNPSEPTVIITSHQGDRDTIIPTFTGTLWIRVPNSKATAYMVHVRVVETTPFSPWWFVGGTDQAFAELRNNTNQSVGLRATFFGSDGTACGSTLLTLPANGNTAVGVKFLGTCAAAVSGSAKIAFWGAPGAVVANITTIDGVQATSFDSPFTPGMDWSGFKRLPLDARSIARREIF